MKKGKIVRYDLDKVYFMAEYNKAVSYGRQNIGVQGVSEQLYKLEQEKKAYLEKVSHIVEAEKSVEQAKYQQYEKWATMEKKCKWAEIGLIALFVVRLVIFQYLPVGLRTSLLFSLFDLLIVLLPFFFCPAAFNISKKAKHSFSLRYNKNV